MTLILGNKPAYKTVGEDGPGEEQQAHLEMSGFEPGYMIFTDYLPE